MSASDKFEKFAESEYGVSGEELSVALVIDTNRDRFEACRRGGPLQLPSNAMDFLKRVGIVGWPRGHIVRKHDVDWRRVDELLALRGKRHRS
jgi:hypothetical protein